MILGVVSLLMSGGGQAQLAANRYELVEYRFDVDPSRKVGTRRTGVFCAAAGSYYWRDVKPDVGETQEVISRALSDAQPTRFVPIDRLSDDSKAAPAYRLRATVTSVELSACSKKWGFGKFFRAQNLPLSGEAWVTVEWTTYSTASHATATRSITTTYSFQAAHDLTRDAIVAAFTENARTFANSPSGIAGDR